MDKTYNFRAWDKRAGIMLYDAATLKPNQELITTTVDTGNPFAHFDGLVWMQKFPELDMDSKEIFEGDVVSVGDDTNRFIVRFGKMTRKLLSHDETKVFTVDFNGFYFEKDGLQYLSITENHLGLHDMTITKVVGNIYESNG